MLAPQLRLSPSSSLHDKPMRGEGQSEAEEKEAEEDVALALAGGCLLALLISLALRQPLQYLTFSI